MKHEESAGTGTGVPAPDETIGILKTSPLFAGFSPRELQTLLPLLGAKTRRFQKGETLLMQGFRAAHVGVVLAGRITAAKTSAAGGEVVVARMKAGGVFGDVLAAGDVKSPVGITAATACTVLLLPKAALFRAGEHAALRLRFLENLGRTVSEKYFQLDRRLALLMLPRLRPRIATWLLDEADRRCQTAFTHGMTRAELARHLGCERSALSREISRMAADGLIACTRRGFVLCDVAALGALSI